MQLIQGTQGRECERGSAIVTVTIVLAVALIALAAFLQIVGSSHDRQIQQRDDLRKMYVAEAGLNEAYLAVEVSPVEERVAAGTLGTEAEPRDLGNVDYWVEAEHLGMRVYALRGTSRDQLASERLELVVREIPDGFFRYAVFGDEGVTIETSAFVDSYDSTIGTYEDQYDGNTGHAGENGNVGSNVDIRLRTNTEIYGNANPGPDHQVIELGPNVTVTGSTQPATELVPMPPIDVPSVPTSGTAVVRRTRLVLGPGDSHYTRLETSTGGSIQIRGPARVVLDSFQLASGTDLILDTAGGPVEIYGTGDFVMRANSRLVTESGRPQDSAIFLTSNNIDGTPRHTVDLSANSDYVGLIYAPNARIGIHAMFHIYGSVIARAVTLGSNSAIHYDVSLLFDDDNGDPIFEQVSWRPIGLQ